MDLEASTELCRALADATRLRLLALLRKDELTVAELVEVTRLPQPRVSTHLSKLKAGGLVVDRRVGASAFYSLNDAHLDAETRALLEILAGRAQDPLLDDDVARLEEVKRRRAQGWPESVAGHMHRHYSPGRTWEALVHGLIGLVSGGDLVDVGSGDGFLASQLAPRLRSVTCVDKSPEVIDAARGRLAATENARALVGDMHALPLPDESFDQALLLSALEHAERPAAALAEVARVLRPGGVLVATTLAAHAHEDAVRAYGHRQMGFDPARLGDMLRDAGFVVDRCEVSSRESKPPHFEVVSVYARRTPAPPAPREGTKRHPAQDGPRPRAKLRRLP